MYLQVVNDLNNAGDLLAPIIVKELFGISITKIYKEVPVEIKEENRPILAGLGSFLGYYGDLNLKVWGTGFEPGYLDTYHRNNPGDRNLWTFHAVRGPLTCRYFDLPENTPVGDPAILTPLFYDPSPKEHVKVRYVLHYDNKDIRSINDEYSVLSTRMHPFEFIDYLTSSDFVLTESLHGAILSHAYGIPWAWVLNKHRRAVFKWYDWFGSIGASSDGVFRYTELDRAISWYRRQSFIKIDTQNLIDSFPKASDIYIDDTITI